MFSTNQIFKITGPVEKIEDTLKFAFVIEGQDKHISKSEKERGCKTVYQISEDGKYFCIGWGFEEIPPGWKPFDPDFTYKRAASAIENFLKQFEGLGDHDIYKDSISEVGFLAENIEDTDGYGNIENPYHGIVKFSRYSVIYARGV